MKTENSNKKMTAVQMIKNNEDMLTLIESIGDQTVKEQEDYEKDEVANDSSTDDSGLFKMDNLLDVEIPANAEDSQPRYYNSPVEPLTDADKAFIVNEFIKMLKPDNDKEKNVSGGVEKSMYDEVIDFSDIGPIATVIQNRFGYKQNLEDFLTELTSKAVDKQDSQAFAHGDKAIPGVETEETALVAAPEVEKAPTDIAPIEVGVEVAPPVAEIAMATEVAPIELAPVEEMAPALGVASVEEVPAVDVAPEAEVVAPVADVAPEAEVVAPVADVAPEAEVIAPVDEVVPPVVEEPAAEEVKEEIAEEKKEEKKEEKDEEKDEKDLDVQLEAIKQEYLKKIDEKKIDAKLESIKSALLAKMEGASETKPVEKKVEIKAKLEDGGQLEAPPAEIIVKEDKIKEKSDNKPLPINPDLPPPPPVTRSVVESEEKVKAKLEAIANGYHAQEKAKVEAVETEKKLSAKLESIANGYHAQEKAKIEAVQAEKKLDEKLNSLVESYHKSNSQPKLENIEQRQKVKDKIEEIKK